VELQKVEAAREKVKADLKMKELETEMVRLKLNPSSQGRSESVRIMTAIVVGSSGSWTAL
jgi:Spy/CpxP family protein refolding chaperone